MDAGSTPAISTKQNKGKILEDTRENITKLREESIAILSDASLAASKESSNSFLSVIQEINSIDLESILQESRLLPEAVQKFVNETLKKEKLQKALNEMEIENG